MNSLDFLTCAGERYLRPCLHGAKDPSLSAKAPFDLFVYGSKALTALLLGGGFLKAKHQNGFEAFGH